MDLYENCVKKWESDLKCLNKRNQAAMNKDTPPWFKSRQSLESLHGYIDPF